MNKFKHHIIHVMSTQAVFYYKNLSLNNIVEEIGGIIYEEQWVDVEGYEHEYQISNFGRVKSLGRMIFNRKTGGLLYNQKMKIIVQHGRRYKQVNLYKDATCDHRYIHILVAEAFLDNPENKGEVNHIEGDKFDNRWIKLEWVTRSENIQHSLKYLGRNKNRVYAKGKDHWRYKNK